MVRNSLLYWGRPLAQVDITYARTRVWLDRFELLGSVLFALTFFALFVYQIVDDERMNALFTVSFWESSRTPVLLYASLGAWCFVLYKSIARKRALALVERKREKESHDETPHIQSWEGALKTYKFRARKDIAHCYTDEALLVVDDAVRVAHRYGEQEVGVWHMFYALLSSKKIANVFVRLGLPQKKLQALISKRFDTSQKNRHLDPRPNVDVQQILFSAYEYAYAADQAYVHLTELLLATVLQSEDIQELLYDLEVDQTILTNVVEWLRIQERLRMQHTAFQKAAARRSKHGIDRAMTAVATPYLNSFSTDLTLAAKFGRLETCVAREKEIEEIFRIINAGRQSIVLVGERGVGKMSILHGIAERMVEERVPARIQDKRLVQISVSALLAGTTVSGAQERVINIMHEIAKAKNIILCVEGIDNLMGAGAAQGEAGFDVSETLAEFLGRGRFLTLATTTVSGYNQHVVNSSIGQALARVDVPEMEDNQTIQVLESKVGYVEYKHKVYFTYDALDRCAVLAKTFLHDQRVPESALSIMTEVASYVESTHGAHSLVSGEDVATIISQKTGIPTTSISEDEGQKLMRLETAMHQYVVGQDDAVALVANALRRARAEIRSKNRPIANFLFLGPTGVGKTELAKTISRVYFGGEEQMIRIDMSEFQDTSSIYRLIGQTGKQGTGLLTEAVRQKPFSLVLLDEMEKAHPDVLNVFLQVFDDGRLTDSVGRVIDFTNTIIIATSNAGTVYAGERMSEGVALEDIRQELIHGKLKEYYRPEFLNRFDAIVLFKSLNREEIKHIAGLMLGRVQKDLETKGIGFRAEDAALEALASVGYDPEFGARPMRRAIQDRVENQLAELLLSKSLERRDTVVLGDGASIRIERGR